tara:strand:+ start:8499 stop:9074 length:576 start_codon:yes stop_codon:yes gene_type:complete
MTGAVEGAMNRLAGDVEFDFLLGGINTHGSQPIGDYGRRHLRKIWRDVQATTGADFGFRLPAGIVYNSLRPCLAVHAVRRHVGKPPFGYLHQLQQRLFVDGDDITDVRVLAETAQALGWPAQVVGEGLQDAALERVMHAEFGSARIYGTNALPAVLIETGEGERRLLAGGYADAQMLESLVRQALARSASD